MSEKEKTFHIATEVLGVVLGIFLITVGVFYSCLPLLIRAALIVSGFAGVVIDTYCISTWK